MGLFDKLIKEAGKVINEVATEENKEKAKQAFSALGEQLEQFTGDLKNKMEELGVDKFILTGLRTVPPAP